MPDTIQEDVVESNQPVAQPEAPVSRRDQVMAELAERRRVEAAGETPEDEPADETPVVEMVALKVDGQEVLKSRSEVEDAGGVAAIQKHLSAERRLAIAAQERKSIEAERAKLAEERRRLDAERQQRVAQTPAIDLETKRKIVAELYSGDETRAEAAIDMLLNARPAQAQQQIDVEQITQEAERRIERKVETRDSVRSFQQEFPEIKPGSRLWAMADQETIAIMREHPSWSPRDVLMEAGNRVRTLIAEIAPQPVAQPIPDRTTAKRAIDSVPRAAGRMPAAQEAKPKTKEQLINEIKRSRGQMVV